MTNKKVILVGRHAPQGLPETIQVVEQKNVEWSTDVQEATRQFYELVESAENLNAAILLQNVPGILAVVLYRAGRDSGTNLPLIGVIISVPGPRLAGVEKRITVHHMEDVDPVINAARFANSRATVEADGKAVKITVDPVSPFVFSHIEWL